MHTAISIFLVKLQVNLSDFFLKSIELFVYVSLAVSLGRNKGKNAEQSSDDRCDCCDCIHNYLIMSAVLSNSIPEDES